MIVLKTARELKVMREAGRISAKALQLVGEAVEPGVSTYELDKVAYDYIKSQGATPGFLHYNGFPASACISINNEVIHGIPSKKRIVHAGDIVSVDVGAKIHGFTGDCAGTYPCGEISSEAEDLIAVTRQSFFEGIKFARPGYRISDIGHAIQEYVEGHGYSVVRAYVGHGVGAELHEEPEVPNYGEPGHGPRLVKGMTLAVEPMVNAGTYDIRVLDNDWTVVTADGKLSAHYENTILITDGEPEILTMAEDL